MFLFYVILCNFSVVFFLRIVHFPKNYMLFKSLLRIAWVMTSQQPFCKMEEKVFLIHFIEIFQSKMKRLHVNKCFHLIILEKIVTDSMLNYSQLSSRLYTAMMAFFYTSVSVPTTNTLSHLED